MLSTVVFLSMAGLGVGVTQPVEGQVSLVGIWELNYLGVVMCARGTPCMSRRNLVFI